MPQAELPSSAKGWFVSIIASLVGLLVGFGVIKLANALL